jgi:hypothetical protein
MQIAGSVLLAIGLVVLAVEVVALVRLTSTVRRHESTARELASRIEALPPDLVQALGQGERQVIVVELLNPLELASRETWVARPLSAVTPKLLRDIVYNKAVSEVQGQMTAMGIEADVRTHRVR